MISVHNLSYKYPGYSRLVLNEISLAVQAGEFIGIIGPNGAGKSTLCYALAGFIPHFYRGTVKGSVEVAGQNIAATSLGDLAGSVGLVVQNPFNQITGARFTVLEEVAFGLENLGIPREEIVPRVKETLALVGLDGFEERSPFALSGGQQQRLAIASVVAMRPTVLILDEPTSQLDPVGTREVFAALHSLTQQGTTTVVLVEHKLEWIASFATRVIAMSEGKILLDGSPRDVLVDPRTQSAGVGSTRYTQSARLAQERGLIPQERALPVTLEDAQEFFTERSRE